MALPDASVRLPPTTNRIGQASSLPAPSSLQLIVPRTVRVLLTVNVPLTVWSSSCAEPSSAANVVVPLMVTSLNAGKARASAARNGRSNRLHAVETIVKPPGLKAWTCVLRVSPCAGTSGRFGPDGNHITSGTFDCHDFYKDSRQQIADSRKDGDAAICYLLSAVCYLLSAIFAA